MNIFYHNEDPLLFQRPNLSSCQDNQMSNPSQMNDMYAQLYKQQLLKEMQQQNHVTQQKDWIGDLDVAMKNLDSSAVEMLNNNQEFIALNGQLQNMIQSEIMSLVKLKLNSQQTTVENIKKQLELIDSTTKEIQKNEKKNLAEINDYMQNYSNLTFDEYKKLKNKENQNM